ncbi:Elongation of very long chain fatty acids protein, partial [Operophtera brumata]
MRDRKPYDLKHTIIVYNISQILMSVFLVYEMAAAVWWYFAAKLIELLDTVFFVLRKKNRQISFLHLYHHFMMPICAWIGVKFLPVPEAALVEETRH